ncbi:MAG TPA: hypothetical protein VEQ60_01935 [Longimicrobium sp.]|nr:hypothetical protein [Longimicrobium sp.]
MKRIDPADPLLDEVAEAQRKLEAEFGNDPAKLLAYYQEAQKRYPGRLRRATDRITEQSPTETASEAKPGKPTA